ncbi:hypothetical protein ATANTOWER_011124 [Ataeniobius toweri]|uniref:Uncharacterized protein n=1 Tax=Ataeniobius toweri TaxID=208326 RepID=A0ABU7BHZ5_9TELE|nr:hypothetical protein [Ataeniobius toweri]
MLKRRVNHDSPTTSKDLRVTQSLLAASLIVALFAWPVSREISEKHPVMCYFVLDLLVHVRDISHPETVNQKANVLNVLKNLQIPRRLLSSMIEVHNKIDLLDNYESSEPGAVLISALQEQGLEELKNAVETEIVKSTGKQILDLRVNLSTPQLSWLYKEATVQDVQVNADEGSAVVKVIMSAAAHGRYKKLFEGR